MSKRRKLSSLFFKLPHEILTRLISHISKRDLLNFGLVSHEYHEVLKPYMYKTIHLGWGDLLALERGALDVYRIYSFVETVWILEYDIRKEWNFNYVALCDYFTSLKSLHMNISNSSNFLKYLPKDMGIEELEIHSMSHESNLFNIEHLQKCPKVKRLKLTGFLIDFDVMDDKVQRLELVNCYWSYPFNLELFSGVVELILNYSNEFVMSERFRYFLLNPQLPQLEYFHVKNMNPILKVHITGKNLLHISKQLKNLKRIQLDGNIETSPIPNGGIQHVKVARSLGMLPSILIAPDDGY